MPKVLITGGAGFIGSHAADRFLAAGYEVVIVDDLSNGKPANVPASADLRVVDVGSSDAAALVASGGFDAVAHFAAQMDVRRSIEDPRFDARTNILGALNLLEAARALPPTQRPRFIFASTGGALYGDGASLPSTETAPANPDAPYGIAKLSVELYLAYYGRVWEMETLALRFGNVYGPRQDPHGEAGVIAIFANRLKTGTPLTIFGDGRQTRDFVFVQDVVDAFFAAATATLPSAGDLQSRAFNIGTGVETSVLDVAHTMAKIAGVPPRIDFKPGRSGEVARSLLAVAKARQSLGWEAKVPLSEGLARTYEWVSSAR